MAEPIERLDTRQTDFARRFAALTARHEERDPDLQAVVSTILSRVRNSGDAALVELTREFDRHDASSIQGLTLAPPDLASALARVPDHDREALEYAAKRITRFHEHQLAESWSIEDEHGNRLGQRVRPLGRVGIYVPGGKASYPSSVLMNAIPAKVAGVGDITMVAPAPEGILSDWVLAAASLAGVDRVLTVGGAQAVAALAYGTETIAPVDKIVGPGNRFVAEAKRQVFGTVGIDMVAGPSEILIVTDGSPNPQWMAMDLFSQAEHDEQAQAILICPDADYLDAVQRAVDSLLPTMERREIIEASLRNRGALIRVKDLEEALALTNQLGPEHLELALNNAEDYLERVDVAGAIFVGSQSCEAVGDYCAGPNHVLPTTGTARFSSPLGVYDFQRRSSVIQCSSAGADHLGRVASALARGESLTAHARSAEFRCQDQ